MKKILIILLVLFTFTPIVANILPIGKKKPFVIHTTDKEYPYYKCNNRETLEYKINEI